MEGGWFTSKLYVFFRVVVSFHCPGYGPGVLQAADDHNLVAFAFDPGLQKREGFHDLLFELQIIEHLDVAFNPDLQALLGIIEAQLGGRVGLELLIDGLVPAGTENNPIGIGFIQHHHSHTRLTALNCSKTEDGVLCDKFEDFFFGHNRVPS